MEVKNSVSFQIYSKDGHCISFKKDKNGCEKLFLLPMHNYDTIPSSSQLQIVIQEYKGHIGLSIATSANNKYALTAIKNSSSNGSMDLYLKKPSNLSSLWMLQMVQNNYLDASFQITSMIMTDKEKPAKIKRVNQQTAIVAFEEKQDKRTSWIFTPLNKKK